MATSCTLKQTLILVFATVSALLLVSLLLRGQDAGTTTRVIAKTGELPVIGQYPIKTVNPNLVGFPSLNRTKDRSKTHNVTEKDFEEEKKRLQAFASKVSATKEPIFPMEKNSAAIITSCKLDQVCVTNIIYTLEFANSDLPIGLLLLLLGITLSFSRKRLLSYSPMNRIVALEKSN